MKFPKLRRLPTILFFFLSGIISINSQVLNPSTLTSSHGSGPTIYVCDSDTVTFTAMGDSGATPNDVEFRIIRGGTTIYPIGGTPGRHSIQSFSYSSFQDGDQVVATVWTYDYGTVSADTNTITISLGGAQGPVSFTSSAIGNVVCNNETVELSATAASTNTMFEFFVNGISIQGPSLVSTVSHVFSSTSSVSLIADFGDCIRPLSSSIYVVDITPGSIAGGGEYCFGDIPNPITSLTFGAFNGSAVTPIFYPLFL